MGMADDEHRLAARSREARIRVVMLIPTFTLGGGGAERLAIAIATNLPPERYEAWICTTGTPGDNSLAVALQDTGVRHVDLARSGTLDLLAARRLIGFLRRKRIDVLHAHQFGSNLWGTVIGRLCRVPVVIAHEHSWSYVGQPLRRLLDRMVISRYADTFVAVSTADRDRMISIEHVKPAKIRVITTAYLPRASIDRGDLRAELGIGADVPVVGTVAILRPQKAIDVLLDAFSRLPDRLSHARLVIAGDGRSRGALEAHAAELGLRERVHFVGIRDDADAVWRAFDVGAISSHFEGTPIAAIEAMTNGVALAATAVGGVPELLENDVSALLVAPRDPAALAAALTRLLDDPVLRARLAGEAQVISGSFSLTRLMKSTEDMYLELLSDARRGSTSPAAVAAATRSA
jgi:glycosyltransferase involved in cell wall biosynthesis